MERGSDWVAKSVMAGPCNRTKLDNAYLERPKKRSEILERTGGRHIG